MVQVGEDVGLGLLDERADIAPTASMAARYADLTVAGSVSRKTA